MIKTCSTSLFPFVFDLCTCAYYEMQLLPNSFGPNDFEH